MTEAKADAYFLERNDGFSEASAQDDLLHHARNARVSDPTLTETQFFGFSVPEHAIHANCYLWHHPNLKTVSGGLTIFQGFKTHQIDAELCDMRLFMSDEVLAGDLHDYRLESSYGVRIIEPMRRFHLSYDNPDFGNKVDVEIEAVMPPVMFAEGDHFEQPMRVQGEILLRGQRYDVESYHIRDRSWGRPRQEHLQRLPPFSWMTAVFSDDFAVNCTLLDQADDVPELRGTRFDLPLEKTLFAGWIHRNGQLAAVVEGRKRVVRDKETLIPRTMDFTFTDTLGRTLEVRGTIIGSCPFMLWNNLHFGQRIARWECEGQVTYGDLQEAIWNDYANFARGR